MTDEQEVWIDPRTKEPCRRCYGTGKMPPWSGSKGLVACGVCRAELRASPIKCDFCDNRADEYIGEHNACPDHYSDADAKLSPQPTFAHSLAGYLTRNGQAGDWAETEKEIDQFMEDSKLEVSR